MGIRYCLHCGMPIPRKADYCPECGACLKELAPQQAEPQISSGNPAPEDKPRRSKPQKRKAALLLAAGLTILCCAAVFFIMDAGEKIAYARSRHRENMMDAQRSAETTYPKIRIPEISMPEISIPDIQLPKPPAAAFAVESYEIETNPAGDTVLYVNINYTNKAENKECFLTNFQISVQQEGAECRQTAVSPERENHLTDSVQPDETVLISEAFIIHAEQEATVSVTAFFGEDKYLEETFFPHTDE